MNFKKYYINGNIRFKIEFKFSRNWNNLMLWLSIFTTFNRRYTVDYYPWTGTTLEKIETWYEKPRFWFFTRNKGVQYTRSTLYDSVKKKEILKKS